MDIFRRRRDLNAAAPISTRCVAMCAGHIIDELITALLPCASIPDVFREGISFLLANTRRANPK